MQERWKKSRKKTMNPMNKNYEKRLFNHEVRMVDEDGKRYIEGYAAKFNTRSEDFGGWYETIAPGAFSDVLKDDVRALIDHDPSKILGRTKSGTLQLWQDETGLRYRAELPNTSYANDLSESVSRGDVDQSSFGFRIADQSWETRDGVEYRVINKVERLYDVSPVTFPAYPDTSVAKRSLIEALQERQEREQEIEAQRQRVEITLELVNKQQLLENED